MAALIRSSSRRTAIARLAVAVLAFVGCSAGTTAPRDRSLDGAWTARSSGVQLLLNLVWTRDSVTGTGTFFALGSALGCGGGTLTGNGTVSFRASRSGATVTGVMAFNNGWTPPYVGTLEDSSRIVGGFRSVDSGSCPYTLIFGLIP